MITVQNQEKSGPVPPLEEIERLLEQNSGLQFDEGKQPILLRRINNRKAFLALDSDSAYLDYLKSSSGFSELQSLVQSLLVNETSFFRNAPHFEALEKTVIPDLIKRKSGNRDYHLNIWSAGCSSGEEAHSIAMVLDPLINNPLLWKTQILGTDIKKEALETASDGIYRRESLKAVRPDLLLKFFIPAEDGRFKLKNEFKKNISFRELNLVSGIFPGGFSIIFCRNVCIYFHRKTVQKILNQFYHSLESGGYLFLGHSESIRDFETSFKTVRASGTVFYQKP